MKKINLNQLIWFIILLGFTLYIHMLLSTGRINVFIHPKMLRQVNFSFYGFVLLAVFQARNLFKPSRHEGIRPGFLIFLIPLLLGFALNPKGVSTSVASQKGVVIAGIGNGICTDYTHVNKDKKSSIKSGCIIIDNENFVHEMEYISENAEESKGKSIVLSGFICKIDDLNENEFLTVRVVISCCAADAQAAGFLCRLDKGEIPPNDTWVTIKGKIDSADYVNRNSSNKLHIPVINVESIELTQKPSDHYIYH